MNSGNVTISERSGYWSSSQMQFPRLLVRQFHIRAVFKVYTELLMFLAFFVTDCVIVLLTLDNSHSCN